MTKNIKIIHVLIFVSLMFMSLAVYITYFELMLKDKVISNPYNRRLYAEEDSILRGRILDRTGVILADSKVEGDTQIRKYPFGRIYSHVIGYNSRSYGKTQLEARYNTQLLDLGDLGKVINIKNKITGKDRKGNNIYLTIDNRLQKLAEEQLGERAGAIVALNPKTGEILAMVSKPDFQPESTTLQEKWLELNEAEGKPLFPRATQGLYPPGSTFKVLMAAAALENGLAVDNFDDKGSIVIDGKKFSNYDGHVYGMLDLAKALEVSSNCYFADLGVRLGNQKMQEIFRNAGIGEKIDMDVSVSKSRGPDGEMQKTELAATAIGQGKLMITPLQMAMIASGIANQGIMMQPYLVKEIISPDNVLLKKNNGKMFGTLMTADTASQLTEMMCQVVEQGTGKKASISGIRVAGKTGTAQNEETAKGNDKEHAWFIAFAPADNPQIAIAVVLEYSGKTGGSASAPLARVLIKDWVNR